MAITIDFANRIIESTTSITDLPVFHAVLRDKEYDVEGAIYPVTHTWKALNLGGGAYFYQVDLINSYQLKFIGSGPFTIVGNLNGSIIDTGVQVERKTSSAFATTAISGTGPSAEEIAAAVDAQLAAKFAAIPTNTLLNNDSRLDVLTSPIDANIVEVNNIPVNGDGTENSPWGP